MRQAQEQIYLLDEQAARILWMNEPARRAAGGDTRFCDLFSAPDSDSYRPDWFADKVTSARQGTSTFTARCEAGEDWDLVEIGLQALEAAAGSGLPVLIARVSPQVRNLVDDAHLQRAQRMEAAGQVAGGLAHDFNNLLTIVSGNLELLHLELEDAGVSEPAGLVDEALSAVRRGAELTQRLLAFARQRPLAPAHLDVLDFVDELRPLLKRSLGANVQTNISVQALDSGDRLVVADKSQFESSLLDLSANAQDAMPEGGRLDIDIRACTFTQPEAENGLHISPGRYLQIGVSDSGAGIAPEVLGKVLDPFFTTKRSGRGSGLGLSMVYGFVKQSGGLMRIESPADSGAAITLFLPMSTESARAEHSTVPLAQSPLAQGGTVLVVEDEPAVRRLASEALRAAGYRVLVADCADAAMEFLECGETFDVLFTDLFFPGTLTSEELVRYVAEHYPDCPIVATSGYVGRHDRAELADASFLSKPYSPSDLVWEVSRVLKLRSSEEETGLRRGPG